MTRTWLRCGRPRTDSRRSILEIGPHILGNIAVNVSASLTQVLRWAHWWNSTEESPDDVTTEQVLVELNTDFSTKGLGPQEIQAIVAAWQAGAISRDTMTDLFRRGEVLPEGRSNEEEEKLIAAAPVESVVESDGR